MINVKDKQLLIIFGQRIRALRIEKELSQEDLANLADVPLSQIGRIERGEVNTTISTCNALAKALKKDLQELFAFSPSH